jgi:hypothetical protein
MKVDDLGRTNVCVYCECMMCNVICVPWVSQVIVLVLFVLVVNFEAEGTSRFDFFATSQAGLSCVRECWLAYI